MQTNVLTSSRSLRNLYFVRTVFQILWAVGVLATAETQPSFAAVLLIAYPLWDVACTLWDLMTSNSDGSARTSQVVNAVLGTAVAAGIGFTIFSQPKFAIATFGAWALGAGVLQLVAGLIRRRQLGGQWAMILSGAQSSVAGIAFLLGGLTGKVHVKDLGGYAIFGAIYFLIAGVLLSRKLGHSEAMTTQSSAS